MDNKKPFTTGQNGRRKSGGSIQLRSPVVKRPSSAPVSIQGWLHKQGSEGLMLWKKRWFVLSEYCLFYYKGPEEEKLLGSILLPSYKVSPCTADDKVYRKFAFKAEHANMRTYYFAAETRELMTKWMNAISLATILQEGGKIQNQIQPSMTSLSSITPRNSDNNASELKAYHLCSGPITIQPTSQNKVLERNNANLNGWMPQQVGNSYQPLYANAPPKPKRLNNEGQYGSSPEASPTRRDDSENIIYGSRKQFQHPVSSNKGQEYSCPSYKLNALSGPDLVRSMPQTLGRKTPDFLGATEIQSPNYGVKISKEGGEGYGFSDFTETGSFNNMFQVTKGQQSFLGYGKTFNQPVVNYQHSNQYYQSYQKAPTRPSVEVQDVDNCGINYYKNGSQPPRPHSADFLDHDTKKFYFNKVNKTVSLVENPNSKINQYNARPPRPKSSLDIMHTSDGYYWSEERYAEKMRQSAIYLQNSLPQRSQSSRTNTPNLKQISELKNFVNYKSGKNEDNSVTTKQKNLCDVAESSSGTQNPKWWSEHQDRLDNYFVRSASARLPKPRTLDDESDEIQAYTGGRDFDEGRKEDSMKRLLEWKQRMLQSPLTRKSSGSSTRGTVQNELSKCYKQQLLKELEKRDVESKEDLGKRRLKPDGSRTQNRCADSRRTAILSSDRYFSYSSDEEENKGTSDKRPQRPTQTGKSRKGNEKPKEKRMTPNQDKTYISPDYENVTDALNLRRSTKQFYECNKSEELSPLHGNTNSSANESKFLKTDFTTKQPKLDFDNENTPDGGSEGSYEILRQTGDLRNSAFSDISTDKKNTSGQAVQSQNSESNQKKWNWNEKIDEVKLIKEFSYQYIKETKIPEKSFLSNYKVLDAPPENIVKSRIKQLGLVEQTETEGKEGVMREPLKVSSPIYSLNEAHVSNLKNSDIKVQERVKTISKLLLNDSSQSSPECESKGVSEKHQKSVKDLLADFERKSQLFQEKEALEHEKSFEEIPGKRYVFSDTETLLYDSSSDTEEKKEEPDPNILNILKKSESKGETGDELTEEEDGDEEVAAALGRRERFFSSCRDLMLTRDSESNRNKQGTKLSGVEPSPSGEVETIMTPGYLRSGLTDLVAALENSDSTCSTPTIEKIKDNLEKSLPRENLSKSAEENLTEAKEENCEGHYMPMTPSRRVSAPSSDKSRSNSSLHSFFLAVEETYVEMAENGFSTSYPEPNKSSLSTISKTYSSHGGPGYCEIPKEEESHYDFLYRTTSFREPEYMEVNTLLEILKEQDEKIKEQKDAVKDSSQNQSKISQKKVPPTPPRSALPDILNSSSGGPRSTKSDSSDADDESSKDLDSLDVPRHPRFSLSDTFRPASYYLGSAINERKRNFIRIPNPCENHDSSDSDLVSPPPIPTSPPLLDDFDTSLETEKSLEIRPNISKVKADKDFSKKMWNKASQDSENEVNMQKKKRQPVSDDVLENFDKPEESSFGKQVVFNELDAAGSRNGLALDEDNGDINLNKYLAELQLNGNMNVHLLSKNFSEKEIHKNLMPKENIYKADSSEKTLLKPKYSEESRNEVEPLEQLETREEVQYENLQALFPPPPPELYDSGNEHSDREASLVFCSNAAFPEVPPPDNYCDAYEPKATDNVKVCFDPVTLQHQTVTENVFSSVENKPSAFENQGAPYYYSDIIKDTEDDFDGLLSDRSLSEVKSFLNGYKYQTLNNQRGNVQDTNLGSKRNDIGRKVNPISESSASGVDSPIIDLNEVQKITEELRTTSAHFMGAANKSGSVDLRNIYESDTLQRRKAGVLEEVSAKTPDLHNLEVVARNLYPHGLKDKIVGPDSPRAFASADVEFSFRNRARSRSLEGLLTDLGYPSEDSISFGQTNPTLNSSRAQSDATFPKFQANHSRIPSCEGDEPWEKDALWRENLRRASLRHTRSLDNLDNEPAHTVRQLNVSNGRAASGESESRGGNIDHNADAFQSGRRSADHLSGSKPKLSRDVTYVNDNFRKNLQLDLARIDEHDFREGRVRSKKRESEIQTVVELKDTGVLDCDDGIHYEKLARNRVNGERSVQSGNYLEGFERREDKKNQQECARTLLDQPDQPVSAEGALAVPQSQVNLGQGLALKPIDREKLRQWDLMSSGIVDQGVVQKKVINADHQYTCENLLNVDDKPSASLSKCQTSEVQSVGIRSLLQGSAGSLEASGSGSAVREPDLTTLSLVNPQILQNQKTPIESTLSSSVLTKQETFLDQKDALLTDRTLKDLTETVEYYDRGKSYLPSSNDYSEWDEPYLERQTELNGDDVIMKYSEKGRSISENTYNFNQYQERKNGTDYSRNSASLPVTKCEPSRQMPLANPLSIARNGSLDGRYAKKRMSSNPWGLDVSAGELLGRTHEELVLLLIQLRRQSASICKAMEACHIEIEEQARMAALDTPTRLEHIRKLEKLKKHLLELEKQYEKGKPLVNLVDNMVKLGSLYKGNNHAYSTTLGLNYNSEVREKLEFNQKVQEQRLLAEERKDWDRLSPDHGQLQAKVQQLYRLDRLLQEESGTLHSLQQDKELLEKALGGLRHKLQVNRSNPIEADRCRKQQKLLEKELSRVRLLLAHNSKKLEETVAENARLEQELVILRQKLQASRVSSRNSVPLLPESATWSTTAALEAELRRVQQLVGDLHRQRHELSAQVKQLTEKSDTLVQQIRPGPTGVAGAGPIPGKKKSSSTWLETDLDLLVTQDVSVENPITGHQNQQQVQPVSPGSRSTTPIYINTETSKKDVLNPPEIQSPTKLSSADETPLANYCTPVELSEADERMKRFYGIIPKEKQEIKTVRIVKRESERRQRDRDRSGNIGIPIGNTANAKRISVIEENNNCGLEKVDEESYDNNRYSPNFSEPGRDYKKQEYAMQEGKSDSSMNYHPTNPFLPQNLNQDFEDIFRSNRDVGSSPIQKFSSLPRGFGKSNIPGHLGNNDTNSELRTYGSRRNRVRFENLRENGGGSENRLSSPSNENSKNPNYSIEADYSPSRMHLKNLTARQESHTSSGRISPIQMVRNPSMMTEQRDFDFILKEGSYDATEPLTPKDQLFIPSYGSNGGNSPQLSPVYQSEAAKQIIMEMSNSSVRSNSNRRQIRKEKRRHHTVSHIVHVPESDDHVKLGLARSRDDLDMERALRPRINAPDVVRSTMSQKDLKYNESTIDNILGTPNKIIIPERYIPEQEDLTAEEQLQRLRKAESIRKMLSETTALSTPDLSGGFEEEKKNCTLRKKVEEEKKQREHLLELNQILAQQVKEKSKLVAVEALAALPAKEEESLYEEDFSPEQPLPIYQQRENFFS